MKAHGNDMCWALNTAYAGLNVNNNQTSNAVCSAPSTSTCRHQLVSSLQQCHSTDHYHHSILHVRNRGPEWLRVQDQSQHVAGKDTLDCWANHCIIAFVTGLQSHHSHLRTLSLESVKEGSFPTSGTRKQRHWASCASQTL